MLLALRRIFLVALLIATLPAVVMTAVVHGLEVNYDGFCCPRGQVKTSSGLTVTFAFARLRLGGGASTSAFRFLFLLTAFTSSSSVVWEVDASDVWEVDASDVWEVGASDVWEVGASDAQYALLVNRGSIPMQGRATSKLSRSVCSSTGTFGLIRHAFNDRNTSEGGRQESFGLMLLGRDVQDKGCGHNNEQTNLSDAGKDA
ncbi:uncharacterized protein B0H18DRAFT_1109422 [Fomitopsis serialis]|uniref:uncharacterized protein n=1 Tax=Fomitopsis serialis TaxID=139415 RepID=UPI00200869BD|nr:uncharacterized protein B0H18DRAFT_1109422 [Neoantrodia serialis]KAH9912124.1 hypothetical protein B0H18DRAFT_1109422 [Neoantrodia serialis]